MCARHSLEIHAAIYPKTQRRRFGVVISSNHNHHSQKHVVAQGPMRCTTPPGLPPIQNDRGKCIRTQGLWKPTTHGTMEAPPVRAFGISLARCTICPLSYVSNPQRKVWRGRPHAHKIYRYALLAPNAGRRWTGAANCRMECLAAHACTDGNGGYQTCNKWARDANRSQRARRSH